MASSALQSAPPAPERDGEAIAGRRILILFTLGLLGAFGPLSLDSYLPALPRVVIDLHTDSSLVQASLTACLVGLAVGQLFAGPASDRHGRRVVMIAGVGVFIVASGLCALAPVIWVLIPLRLVQGWAGASGIAASRATVRDLYSGAALGRIYSRLLLVSGSAPVIAPLLGAQVLHFGGWRAVFWVLAGIGVCVLALTVRFVPETLSSENRTDNTARATLAVYGRILRGRDALPYVICAACFSGVLFGFIAGSPFVVQRVYGTSATTFSLVFAGVSVGMIGLGQLNARLVRHHSLHNLTVIGMTASTAGSLGMLAVAIAGPATGLALLVVVLVFAATPNGVVFPNCTALVLGGHPENAGAAAGVMGLATFLIGGLVSPVVGAAGARSALPMGIVMATSACVALSALVLLPRCTAAGRA